MRLTIIIMIILFASFSHALSNYPATNPLEALYAWNFDEGGGTTTKDYGTGNNLTFTNTYRWNTTLPPVGTNWIDYYGTSGVGITTYNTGNISGVMSISFWMKSSDTTERAVISKWDEAGNNVFRIKKGALSANSLYGWVSDDGTGNGQGEWSFNFTLQKWYHVVIVLDPANSNCTMWVNATFISNWECGSETTLYKAPNTKVYVGDTQAASNNWLGGIDQVIIFNRTITQAEIDQLFLGNYVPSSSNATMNNVDALPDQPIENSVLYGIVNGSYVNNSYPNSYQILWYKNSIINKTYDDLLGIGGTGRQVQSGSYLNLTNANVTSHLSCSIGTTSPCGDFVTNTVNSVGGEPSYHLIQSEFVNRVAEANWTAPTKYVQNCPNGEYSQTTYSLRGYTDGYFCARRPGDQYYLVKIDDEGTEVDDPAFDYGYWNNTLSELVTHTGDTNFPTLFNISSSGTLLNQNWTLSARSYYNYTFSPWLNDSVTVQQFVIDNCTTGTFTTATFSIFDEQNPSQYLNATTEIEGTYWAQKNLTNYTITTKFVQPNTFNLCMTPGNVTLYADMYFKYSTPNGFTHRWFFVNQTLNSSGATFLLGNFNTTDGISDLKITVRKNSNFQYLPNIIGKLQRHYVSENVWRTVQMDETGDFGLLFYNIEEETTDYRIIYMNRQNQLLKMTASLKFVCTSGICDVTQQLDPTVTSPVSDSPHITVNFENSTKLLNTSFNVGSGDMVTLRTIVTRETMTGADTVCDDTKTGSSGLFTCNVSLYSGSFIVSVYEGVEEDQITTSYISSPDFRLSNYISLVEGAFWTFGIILTVVMFGIVIGPVGALITTFFGIIIIFFLQIFPIFSVPFVLVSAVISIIIAIKVRT